MDTDAFEQSRRRSAGLCGLLLGLGALAAFVWQLPAAFFPYIGGPWWLDWFAFAVLYMVYATASLPFDVWAGYWLPCMHGRRCTLLPVYLGTLFRAESLQFAVMTLSALAMLESGKRWGAASALAALAAAQALLAAFRAPVARWLGARAAGPLPWQAWAPGFVWNLAGMGLMLSLPWCSAKTVYELVEALLGFSLWSLAGYWLLRGRQRRAALALLYLSWAGFGLFSRLPGGMAGAPETWAAGGEEAGRPGASQAERKSRAASQISSTQSRSS